MVQARIQYWVFMRVKMSLHRFALHCMNRWNHSGILFVSISPGSKPISISKLDI